MNEFLRWLVLALWAAEILLLLSGLEWIAHAMVAGLAIFAITSLAFVRRGTRQLAFALLSITVLVAIKDGQYWAPLDGLAFAAAFPAFLATMGLMRATALANPTIGEVRDHLSRLRDVDREGGFMVASHVLGALITAGTFGILSPLAPKGADEEARRRLALACLRGVNLAVLWSPFFVGTAVVTHYLPELPLWQIVLQGGLIVLGSYALLLWRDLITGNSGLWRAIRLLMPLLPPVLILACLVILLASATSLSALQSVFLVVPPVIALYLTTQSRASRHQAASSTWQSLAVIKDELLLVTVVGILSLTVAASPTAEAMVAWIVDQQLPPALLAVILLNAILLLAMTGVHPMATASVILALMAGSGTLAPLTLAAIGLLGWGMGTMVSPGSITVLIAANLFEVPPAKLVFSRNLIFVFTTGSLSAALSAHWLS